MPSTITLETVHRSNYGIKVIEVNMIDESKSVWQLYGEEWSKCIRKAFIVRRMSWLRFVIVKEGTIFLSEFNNDGCSSKFLKVGIYYLMPGFLTTVKSNSDKKMVI